MATTNIAPREPIKKQMAKLAMPQSNVLLQFNQGYSATRIEYQITRWLALLASVSTLGRQSVNVRISKDY